LPELWRLGLMHVRITREAVETIAREAATSNDGRETGGILLGFDAGELGELLVMEAGGPGPTAERRADYFRRDLAHARQLAEDAYRRTTARWVGEWHTHPHGRLSPSRLDLKTYRGFLGNPTLHFPVFFAVIVGRGSAGWQAPRATAWLIERRRVLGAVLLPTAAPASLAFEDPSSEEVADV
jgi:integrative and conjugative element protein (TIGR02256 family)